MKIVLEETMEEVTVEVPPEDGYSGVTIQVVNDLEGIRVKQNGKEISFTAWRDVQCPKSK